MNKKLIKTIASVTCGLGIIGSIPFITTSCGNKNEEAVSLELVSECDYELSGEGDYVDFIINEPVSPIYHDRAHNGHTTSHFIPEDADFRYSADSMRDYFVNHFWPESESEYTGSDKVPYTEENPTYGFYYDKANDKWHFMFKLAEDIPYDFNIQFSVQVGVPMSKDSEGNDVKDFRLTNECNLVFFPKNGAGSSEVAVGNIKSITYKFTNQSVNGQSFDEVSLSNIATKLMAIIPDEVLPNAPEDKTRLGWANWFTNDILNSPNVQINNYRSNILGFLYVAELYNFFKELHDPSQFLYGDDPLKYEDYFDAIMCRTSVEKDGGYSNYHPYNEERAKTLNGTVHLSYVTNSDNPDTEENDIQLSVVNYLTIPDREESNFLQGVIYGYDYGMMKDPHKDRVILNSVVKSNGLGAYVQNYNSRGDFFIVDVEKIDTIFDNTGNKGQLDGTFNYITHWCTYNEGIEELLNALFPSLQPKIQ